MNHKNEVVLIGNLGKDPELRYTSSGKAVCNFSLATTDTWVEAGVEKTNTEWHRIVVWGKSAVACAEYIKKGSPIYIDKGKMRTRSWEDKSGTKRYTTEVHANRVEFLNSYSKAQEDVAEVPQQQELGLMLGVDEEAEEVLAEIDL